MRLALALAACLAASPALADDYGPPCLTPSTALANALARNATAGRLDGAEATDLLARLNEIPPTSTYHADSVVIVLRSDSAVVGMFDACLRDTVIVRLDAFADVWRKARGDGV